MTKTFISIIILILLYSCSSTIEERNKYSEEFLSHFMNSTLELRADSVIFPSESGCEVVLIPTSLELDVEYIFIDYLKQELSIRRINYTDIEYVFKQDDYIEEGVASLSPYFYLGFESVDDTEGFHTYNPYFVLSKEDSYLSSIGIGTYNTEGKEEPFAYLIMNKKFNRNYKLHGWNIMRITYK